jgi:hypothetical protein
LQTLKNEAISKTQELEISREAFMEISTKIPFTDNGNWTTEIFGIKMKVLGCRVEDQE